MVLAGDSQLTEASPRRSVTKLAPRLRAAGFDVVTVAEAGANSRDVLQQRLLPAVSWVVCSVGTNDAAPWKQVPLEEFGRNCDQLLAATVQYQWLMLGPGPVIERGAPGERTNETMAAYGAAVQQVAERHGARFVSLADVLASDDLADDGVHIIDSGYAKLAHRVLREIDPLSR